ncbi:uncharacterized protein LOC120086100 [Benincasa hispida]|uniref:uncharacterized protein LOC120086100 n=1 Tax=Benincasa hispida TaxID=102211 RepID=UPI001900ED5A|nr:uncharacterized protein LOC120086100 [Benincasa hispida]
MSWVKGKSPGWAAFNLKQQNNGLQDEVDRDPFPPVSTTLSSLPPCENSHHVNGRSGRSFSFAPHPSANSLTSPEKFDAKKTTLENIGAKKTILDVSNLQNGKKVVEETADVLSFWKLKELHSWADISLIMDVMEAVNNNFDEASTLLKTMVASDNFEINNEMSTLGLPYSNDLSWVTGNYPGWEEFNLKQHNRGLQDETDLEPLPPMLTGHSSLPPCESLHRVYGCSGKSFSSVPRASADSLTSPENYGAKKTIPDDSSIQSGKKVVEESADGLAFWKLKELHSWADFSLIVDIMEAVNNNFNEASTLLKTMVSSDNFDINDEMSTLVLDSANDLLCNGKNDVSTSLERTANIPIPSSTLKDVQGVHQNNNACEENYTKLFENNYFERNFFHNAGYPKIGLGLSKSVPIEPEWEEDDIYLSHRKDAIAMMRSASQHSRAATNAYLRKDHASAKYHSSRAQEQWLAAKMLNDKAANEILQTRNSKNGLWKLDLHGLHAAEAVQALQEHLLKIETRNASNRSLSPKKSERKGFQCASSLEYLSCMDSKVDKESPSSRHRPTSLEVITGIGKHSRGEATLPKAVTSFLSENGYRFEQLRPGTISIRPKFRR